MAISDYQRRKYKDAKPAYAALMKVYPFTLEDLDSEQWADIAGYEGLYQVSTFGRVKSFKYNVPRIMKPVFIAGRLSVPLTNNKTIRCPIHRLVAQTFIPNPDNKPQVDHIDGQPFNNYVSNLRWATASENTQYAYDLGLAKSGEENYQAGVTNEQAVYIRENPNKLSTAQLAKKFSVAQGTIYNIIHGKTYKQIGGNICQGNYKSPCARPLKIPLEIRERIRAEYVFKSTEFGARALSEKFKVSQNAVLKIVHEK